MRDAFKSLRMSYRFVLMNGDGIDCCLLGWIDSDDYYHGDDNDNIHDDVMLSSIIGTRAAVTSGFESRYCL